jgi:hypothetical protein
MTFPSYHLQQASVQNQEHIHKNYVRPFVVGGNFSHDSESGSDDCNNQKAKKRSHRPRGCRGGGSRRARKERRELQFIEMKRQQQEHMQLMNVNSYPTNICHGSTHQVSSVLPPSLSSSSYTSTSISFLTFPHMVEGTSLQQSMGLPHLQPSLSFSSNESEPSEKLIATSKTSNFDILPSMPSEIQRGDSQRLSGQCYRSMAALPPLSSATSSTFHTSQPQKSAEDILRSSLSYTYDAATIATQNLTTGHVQHDVNNQTGKLNFKDEITMILPSHKIEKSDNWIVSQSTSIPSRNTTSASHSNDSSLSAGNNMPKGERFFLTRKILSETGNSFFATSPKSFLLGKKKSPVFCFQNR